MYSSTLYCEFIHIFHMCSGSTSVTLMACTCCNFIVSPDVCVTDELQWCFKVVLLWF